MHNLPQSLRERGVAFDVNKIELDPELESCSMAELPIGASARVSGLIGVADFVNRRLFDLGFHEGARVEYLRHAPVGDPLIFRVNGAELVLRRAEAQRILVVIDR